MGRHNKIEEKRKVLEELMGVSVEVTDWGQFKVMNVLYDVLDWRERPKVAKDRIQKHISTINPRFLSMMTGHEEEVFDKLEGENKAVADIVDATCGLERFVRKIAELDGWGTMLAIDGKELGMGLSYFAYRIN